MATIITTHIPMNEAAAPSQDCPGILVGRVGVEDVALLVLVEHADSLAVAHVHVRLRIVVDDRAALDRLGRERHVVVVVEVPEEETHLKLQPIRLLKASIRARGARETATRLASRCLR
jgi:hypothetical protein